MKGSKERPSEAKAAAVRENARKPRINLPAEVREDLVKAKARLLQVATGPGFDRLVKIISDPESPPEVFQWAMSFVGDRAGLPRLTEQHVSSPPFVVQVGDQVDWLETPERVASHVQ